MKMTWLTDIHLNFLASGSRKKFYQSVAEKNSDAILITGDIAEARDVCKLLTEFSAHVDIPIYFVLGNHDYYHGGVISVREKIIDLCAGGSKLHWLGKPEIITLTDNSILIGHDGWADARYGDFDHSPINLNDSRLITELFKARLLNKSMLKSEMQRLADADAAVIGQTLNNAIKLNHKKVIIATHVPPFPESAWHKSEPCDKDWQPYFSSKATGDVIAVVAKKYPEIEFLVLCGHTHTRSAAKLFNNLEIRTGGAEYYQPEIQEFIEIQ
jgi:predicted phosphohydrolase